MPQIPIGCKLPVQKINGDEKTWIMAEVLSIRFADTENPQYYCHFDLYNKRLDEWVSIERMDVTKMKMPSPKKKPPHPKVSKLKQKDKKARRKSESAVALKSPHAVVVSEPDVEQSGESVDLADLPDPSGSFSKEKEIEKLRTSGSMTQSQTEISRLKNINRICMGKSIIDTWYFAPYPEEFTKLDVLFICEFCLEPVGSEKMLERHRQKCTIRHPPDGRKQRHYCRNLCLISKLFLDHKTLYYEVDPFLYYIMTRNDERGMHVIGYFSKEKSSAEDYNVACILTLPQYQRKGYGKLLIAFSYELSLIERKTGSPEKPLSDLGLLSYRSYWADTIIDMLMNNADISIQRISEITSITTDDILNTLYAMDMLKFYKGQFIFYVSEKNVAHYEKKAKKPREKIDPNYIEWTPPKFLPSQLLFA